MRKFSSALLVFPGHGLERGEVVIRLRPDGFGREGDEFLEHGVELGQIVAAHFAVKLGEGGGVADRKATDW